MKTCKKCEETKEYSDFFKDKSKKDGFDIYCKECNKIRKSHYYLKNKELIIEKNSKWKEKNRIKQGILRNCIRYGKLIWKN